MTGLAANQLQRMLPSTHCVCSGGARQCARELLRYRLKELSARTVAAPSPALRLQRWGLPDALRLRPEKSEFALGLSQLWAMGRTSERSLGSTGRVERDRVSVVL